MDKARLVQVMRRELDNIELQLSPYCIQQIDSLLANGIKRMRMTKTLDHSGYTMQAERNLKTLIHYFKDHAGRVGTYPKLDDKEFDAALRNCPTIWPFCASG